MLQINKFGCLLLCLGLFSNIKCANSRRLSLKESLTAYAEKDSSESESEKSLTSDWKTEKSRNNGDYKITSLQLPPSKPDNGVQTEKAQTPSNTAGNLPSSNGGQFSLWKLTKSFLAPLKSAPPFTTSQENATHTNTSTVTVPHFFASTSANFVPSRSELTSMHKTNTPGHSGNGSNKKSDGPTQPRNKKEVSANPGLKQVLWNTANALFSVNKIHFLPTALHTKTGGKLSLIRDSIFKPITILSQYKNGVQQINNEKIQSLARLHTGGWGWNRPSSEVVLVKVQPENSHVLTLAKYIFRLTKHTVLTKVKLKRALLDLQLRAARKLLQILQSKTLAQKVATIKILSNAAWKGKIALLQIITGAGRTTTTPSPSVSYPGPDNSGNVDITYSSLNNYNKGQAWMNYVAPPQNNPPPPLPPVSSNNYMNYYTTSQNNAEPPPSAFGTVPEPSTIFVPPSAAQSQVVTRTSFPPPHLITFTTSASDNHYHQLPSTTTSPLIETPSYSMVLKTMGIHPTNLETSASVKTEMATSNSSSTTTLESPKPTVVYFTTQAMEEGQTGQTDITNPYKINEIEESAASIEYHTSLEPVTDDAKLTVGTTPATPFRMKLLEAMNINAARRRQVSPETQKVHSAQVMEYTTPRTKFFWNKFL